LGRVWAAHGPRGFDLVRALAGQSVAVVSMVFDQLFEKAPQQDSNLRTRLRRPGAASLLQHRDLRKHSACGPGIGFSIAILSRVESMLAFRMQARRSAPVREVWRTGLAVDLVQPRPRASRCSGGNCVHVPLANDSSSAIGLLHGAADAPTAPDPRRQAGLGPRPDARRPLRVIAGPKFA